MKRIALLSVTIWILLFAPACSGADAASSERRLTLLFTHDLHSFFTPVRVPESRDSSFESGGYARLATLIKQARERHGAETLLVDAGDISMGTLFHTVYDREASELRLMGRMGYDVVTFGNHEFDFHTGGLAAMLETAKSKGGRLPEIVFANAVFKENPGALRLRTAFEKFPVKDYTIVERNGLRIGVFGVLGKDASEDMAFSDETAFTDRIQIAKQIVNRFKKAGVDLILCLSHSGTSRIKKRSDDEVLAREVPEIDVIVSGHSHTVLPQPIRSGKTLIVSCGSYGAYLGVLRLACSRSSGVRLDAYELKPVTAAVPESSEIAGAIGDFKKIVERQYLSTFGYRFEQAITRSGFNMESLGSILDAPRETGLANLIADSFRHAVARAEGKNYAYTHVIVVPLGLIRDSFIKGNITVEDVFRTLSLGLGEDGQPGYPLVSYYISGRELKALLEVHTSIAPFKRSASLNFSGVRFTYNPNRIPFERVTSMQVRDADGSWKPPVSDRLYRVCAGAFTAQRIDYIRNASHGLIDIQPKDRSGQPVTDLKKAVIYALSKDGRPVEVKEWTALAGFLSSLPAGEGSGLPRIPEVYRGPDGRIKAEASWNPVKLVAGGGAITVSAAAIVLIVLILFAMMIGTMIKRAKKWF